MINRTDLDAFLGGIAGCIVIYLLTQHSGIGVSPDSVVYTSVARNIYLNGHLEAYNHMPLVDFPVLYPVFLSVIAWVSKKDPVSTGPILNGILFGLVIFLCGRMMRIAKGSRMAQWAFIIALIISPALLDIYTMLWSETLFILLIIAFFFLCFRYLNQPTVVGILLLAVCAGLSCITRYAGITLVGAGGLLLFFNRSLSWKKRFGHSLLFGLVSITFLVANLWRNAQITGTFTGNREKGVTPFGQNLYYYGTVLYDWLPFLKGHYGMAKGIAALSLIIGLLVLIRRIIIRWNYASFPTITLTFFLVYVLFIVVSATISRYEQINNRLLAPAFIPLLFIVIHWLSTYAGQYHDGKMKVVTLGLPALLFAALLVSQWRQTHQLYHEFSQYGIPGYTDDSWRHTRLPGFLKSRPGFFTPGITIYSNAHEAAYFVDHLAAESLPHTVDKEDMESFFENKAHYLIWYHHVQDTDLVSLKTLATAKDTTPVYRDETATIYWCGSKQ